LSALDKALNHSKNIGINECEIIVVKKRIITVRITESEIAEIKQNFDENYGIRLIHDKKIVSIQTTNQQEIEEKIDCAFKTSSKLKARDFWKGLPYDITLKQLDGTFDEKLEKISGAKVMDIAQNMINSANNDKATYISGIINAESEYGTIPVSGIGHASGRTLSNFVRYPLLLHRKSSPVSHQMFHQVA